MLGGGFSGASGWLWGRMEVAFGCLPLGYQHALRWLRCRIDVALGRLFPSRVDCGGWIAPCQRAAATGNPAGFSSRCRPAAGRGCRSSSWTRPLDHERLWFGSRKIARRGELPDLSALIQRAANTQSRFGHHMRVDLRGRNIFVPQQLLRRASTVHAAASPASGAPPKAPSGSPAACLPDP